jgi:AraC-like DNA-binding protein
VIIVSAVTYAETQYVTQTATRARKRKQAKRAGAVEQKPTFAEQTSAIDDKTGPLGVRLVTQREGEQIVVRTSGAALVVPVHAGLADVVVGDSHHAVDRAAWLLLPAGTRAVLHAKSPVTHTFVLTISKELCEEVACLYEGEIDRVKFVRILSEVQLLPRTTWVNELCHRYLFERAVCKKRDNTATKFLENEIVKELYFLCHDRFTSTTIADQRRSVVEAQQSPLVERAIAVIEADLFEADVAKRLTKKSGASASTLLRMFKKELGVGPLAYIRKRRLDESMLLLKAKRYSVGEVAQLVGYRNFAAFSQAFRVRFGMKPSEVATRD